MPTVCQSRLLAVLKATFWISALAIGETSAIASQKGDTAQEHANRGARLVQAGDLDKAEADFREALRLSPDNTDYMADLGGVLGMQRKYEESNFYFEKALKIDPANLVVRRNLAANQWQAGRLQEAKRNLELILKARPGDEPTILLLGMVSENLKDYARAARLLGSMPGLVQQRPESIAALARSYYRLGQQQKAREALGAFLLHPAAPESAFLGGQVASEEGDGETALKLFTSIESTYPDPAILTYNVALVEYRAGQFRECQDTLLGLIGTRHQTSDAFNLLAWCYYHQEKYRETVRAFDQAIDLEPTKESNYLDLGQTLIEHRLYGVGLAVAQKAVERIPSSYRAFMLKGMAEAKQARYTEATKSFARAVELNPGSPEANSNLATVQFQAGMTKEAEATFEQGIRKFPHDALTRQEYALMLLRRVESGDATLEPRAVSLLEAAVVQDPSLAGPHYHLGNLWLTKGKIAEADAELEQAAKLDSKDPKIRFALSRACRRLGRTEQANREFELYQKLKADEEKSSDAYLPGGS